MGDLLEMNRCENCGQPIARDYGRKLPRWTHTKTGSYYCEPESLNIDRAVAEPKD
jgi:hypothetical protein